MCDLKAEESWSMIIPNGEVLFRYVRPEAFPPGQIEIPDAIFNDKALSCDWKRFRPDPQSSKHVLHGKSVVVSITVCDGIRNPTNPKNSDKAEASWHQTIIHNPVTAEEEPVFGENPAHVLIRGKKKAAVRHQMKINSSWKKLKC